MAISRIVEKTDNSKDDILSSLYFICELEHLPPVAGFLGWWSVLTVRQNVLDF